MTEVVVYICKFCNTRFGPMGFHGYNPKTGTGELPGTCRKCQDMVVLILDNRIIKNEQCPKCQNQRSLFDGKCPQCNSDQIVFTDIKLPGFERKANKVEK